MGQYLGKCTIFLLSKSSLAVPKENLLYRIGHRLVLGYLRYVDYGNYL